MEISNNPAITLIPSILGEKPASQLRDNANNANKSAQSDALAPRLVSEAERRAARQAFEENQSENAQNGLYREQPLPTSQQRAISAYQDNEQTPQKENLSAVLGIDVYS